MNDGNFNRFERQGLQATRKLEMKMEMTPSKRRGRFVVNDFVEVRVGDYKGCTGYVMAVYLDAIGQRAATVHVHSRYGIIVGQYLTSNIKRA